MAGSSYVVRGEAYIDGNASGGIDVILYDMGSDGETRTLLSTEFLNITDIFVHIEDGGDFSLYMGTDATGKRILKGNVALNGGVSRRYQTPFRLPRGVVPTFVGSATNRNACYIEGFITEA